MSDMVGRRKVVGVVASNRAAWWPVAGCFGLVAACNKNKHSPIFLRAPGSLLVCPRSSVLYDVLCQCGHVGPCILLIRTGRTAVKTPLRNFYEVDIYPTALFSKTALRSR